MLGASGTTAPAALVYGLIVSLPKVSVFRGGERKKQACPKTRLSLSKKTQFQFIALFQNLPPGGRWPKGPDEGIQSGKEPPHQSKNTQFQFLGLLKSMLPGTDHHVIARLRQQPWQSPGTTFRLKMHQSRQIILPCRVKSTHHCANFRHSAGRLPRALRPSQ